MSRTLDKRKARGHGVRRQYMALQLHMDGLTDREVGELVGMHELSVAQLVKDGMPDAGFVSVPDGKRRVRCPSCRMLYYTRYCVPCFIRKGILCTEED